MKAFRIFLIISVAFVVAFSFSSCEKEETYGTPRITNVRLPDPETAGQSLAGGNLGQMIVIQGENLSSTQQVMFNNIEAFFNPTLVTDNNIIVTIPGAFPSEINDLITVTTAGGVATYGFAINIPSPIAEKLPLEWVSEGGILTIMGSYFYNVESVEFTGGVSTTSFTVVSPEKIEVVVPPDAAEGPVKVHAVAGTGTTREWFRDSRYMMIDYMEHPVCWGGEGHVIDVTDMPAGMPVDPVNGNFLYVKNSYGDGSWWIQETVAAYCGDLEVTGLKSDWALTFEMWVGEAWDSNWFEIIMIGDGNAAEFDWLGFETLGGEDKVLKDTGWMTVKIPLSAMGSLSGSNFKLDRFGSYKAEFEDTIEFAFDNFRFSPLN